VLNKTKRKQPNSKHIPEFQETNFYSDIQYRDFTRPEESYRLWRVVMCDQETSKTEEAKARYRDVKIQPLWVVTPGKQ
jgi:hypothetical protein